MISYATFSRAEPLLLVRDGFDQAPAPLRSFGAALDLADCLDAAAVRLRVHYRRESAGRREIRRGEDRRRGRAARGKR